MCARTATHVEASYLVASPACCLNWPVVTTVAVLVRRASVVTPVAGVRLTSTARDVACVVSALRKFDFLKIGDADISFCDLITAPLVLTLPTRFV